MLTQHSSWRQQLLYDSNMSGTEPAWSFLSIRGGRHQSHMDWRQVGSMEKHFLSKKRASRREALETKLWHCLLSEWAFWLSVQMSLIGFYNWNSFEHQIIFFSKSFHFLRVILDTDTNKLFRKQATPRLESMVNTS